MTEKSGPSAKTCELVADADKAVGQNSDPKSAIVNCRKDLYGIQFRVVDVELNPIQYREYEIRRADGKKVEGRTDSNGLTQIVRSDKAEKVSISVNFIAPKRMISLSEFESPVDFTLIKIEGDKVVVKGIKIDDKAAIREVIFKKLSEAGMPIKTSSEWGAKPSKAKADWGFSKIALHHAGNSYSCGKDTQTQLKEVEKTDVKSFGHISYHYAIACSGEVYEALDIRFKGAHISNGNTGNIGIVMLTDLTDQGEAYAQEYSKKGILDTIRKGPELLNDKFFGTPEEPPERQILALEKLVEILDDLFRIKSFGGHREYQVLANKEGRACPGNIGMKLVNSIRAKLGIGHP